MEIPNGGLGNVIELCNTVTSYEVNKVADPPSSCKLLHIGYFNRPWATKVTQHPADVGAMDTMRALS